MRDAPWSGNESLPLTLAQRVDAVCNRFEQAWLEGHRPALKNYLADMPEPRRAALLRELITLDMAYRRRPGEQPQPDEYRARFSALSQSLSATGPHTPSPQGAGSLPTTAGLPHVPGYEVLGVLGQGGMGIV